MKVVGKRKGGNIGIEILHYYVAYADIAEMYVNLSVNKRYCISIYIQIHGKAIWIERL